MFHVTLCSMLRYVARFVMSCSTLRHVPCCVMLHVSSCYVPCYVMFHITLCSTFLHQWYYVTLYVMVPVTLRDRFFHHTVSCNTYPCNWSCNDGVYWHRLHANWRAPTKKLCESNPNPKPPRPWLGFGWFWQSSIGLWVVSLDQIPPAAWFRVVLNHHAKTNE